jgi:DNA-binding XRE family transcriptional regulator
MQWSEDHRALAKQRREVGLTQDELAKRVGKSRSVIRDIESGRIKLRGETAIALWEAIAEAKITQRKDVDTLSSLRALVHSPEQRFEREFAALKRSAADLLRTHSTLAKTDDQLLALYKQDEAKLTDYQKEVRLSTIEILHATMRQLRETLQEQVTTLEALSGASGPNPIEPEPSDKFPEEEEKVKVNG